MEKGEEGDDGSINIDIRALKLIMSWSNGDGDMELWSNGDLMQWRLRMNWTRKE